MLRLVELEVFDPCEEEAGVADDGAARLEEERDAEAGEPLREMAAIGPKFEGILVALADAEAAAQVHVFERNAFGAERVD